MKRYLLSIIQPDGEPPPTEVMDKVMRDVDRLLQEAKAAGAITASTFRPANGNTFGNMNGSYVNGATSPLLTFGTPTPA